jgi:HEAT repeat protein
VTSRLTPAVLLLVIAVVSTAAQERPASELQSSLERLSAFDYSTRTAAARVLRRVPMRDAVPLLAQAARSHADQFVRYRALVLLTAFNDPGTPALMRELLGDRNDRVREVAYRWFERHPERQLTAMLLGALNTELAEFVRPALVRALAALDENADVQRALLGEAGR